MPIVCGSGREGGVAMNEGCGGVEMPSLTKTDDESARPPAAGLSKLGSGTFETSDIVYSFCCLFRGSGRPDESGPARAPRTVPSGYEPPTAAGGPN